MAAQINQSLPSWVQLGQLERVIPMSFEDAWTKPLPWAITGMIALVWVLSFSLEEDFPHTKYPLQNPRKFWDVTSWKAKWDFIFGVRTILEKRIAEAPNEPYRILTDFGDMTILPPDYANEIRNSEDLSFDRVVEKVRCDAYSGRVRWIRKADINNRTSKHIYPVSMSFRRRTCTRLSLGMSFVPD